ncbi:MAG: Fic family protein, partial [Hymenobacter sp.]
IARQQRAQTAWRFELNYQHTRWQFSFNLPRRLQQELYQLDRQVGGERGADSTVFRGQERNQLLVNSRMEEAIASSQMEGANTTREVAKELLRTRRQPRNTSERMIVNNYRTMRHLREMYQQPLTVAALLELQALVTTGTLENATYAGRLRDHDGIYVVDHASSEVVHMPPMHEALPELLSQFCRLANDEDEAQNGPYHPVVKAAILHFLLGFIHPFVDGNGRTARVIFYWYLLRKNYGLIEYMPISRIIKRSAGQYGRAYLFSEQDQDDLTYFISYQVQVVRQAWQELAEYASRQRKQLGEVRRLLLTQQLNERQTQLIQWLREHPDSTLTIREIQRRFNTAYATARADLIGLEQLNLLTAGKAGKQKLLYFRADDFDQQLAKLKG